MTVKIIDFKSSCEFCFSTTLVESGFYELQYDSGKTKIIDLQDRCWGDVDVLPSVPNVLLFIEYFNHKNIEVVDIDDINFDWLKDIIEDYLKLSM